MADQDARWMTAEFPPEDPDGVGVPVLVWESEWGLWLDPARGVAFASHGTPAGLPDGTVDAVVAALLASGLQLSATLSVPTPDTLLVGWSVARTADGGPLVCAPDGDALLEGTVSPANRASMRTWWSLADTVGAVVLFSGSGLFDGDGHPTLEEAGHAGTLVSGWATVARA